MRGRNRCNGSMRASALLAALMLNACMAGARSLRSTPEIADDPFAGQVTILGIEQRYGDAAGHTYFLRTWVDRSNRLPEHQLYVNYSGVRDWAHFTRANDEDTDALEVVEIDSDTQCYSAAYPCILYESFGIGIADDKLRQHGDGYAVKAYAQSGAEIVLEVSAEQIGRQLAATDSVLASLR
jgi:hypothetical protein